MTEELIQLTIKPASGLWQAPPDRRLARLLKTMLRGYGWRCVGIKPCPNPNVGLGHTISHPKEPIQKRDRFHVEFPDPRKVCTDTP